jgi:ankyrin repeat protein
MDELLLKAAAEGDFAAAQVALRSGASKDATTDFGFTALHVAATKGHLPVVRLLIDAGADVDRRERHGVSPLLQAVGWPGVMEALLDAGADVDGATVQGVTPLMSAAAFGEMESVRLLLARGADPNRRDDSGSSAADFAGEKGEDEIASLLLGLADKPNNHEGGR